MQAKDILQQLAGRKVMIVGDVMVDRYLTGTVARISPEAPVPVVLQHAMEDRLGGAANVALNIRALGGLPILCSVLGNDTDGNFLKDHLLARHGIDSRGIVCSDRRRTTVKMRVLGNNQQMLRIDSEDAFDLDDAECNLLETTIRQIFEEGGIEVVILQDYNKGVLTQSLIQSVIRMAREKGIPTAVDPKKANFFAYVGVDLFKPNLKEIRESAPFTVNTTKESLDAAAGYLHEMLQNRFTMITLSEKGLYLNIENAAGEIYPTTARNVADVSGAGDTVISIAALGMAAGLPWRMIAALSNLSGGQVCEFPGVVPVRLDLLTEELDFWLMQT